MVTFAAASFLLAQVHPVAWKTSTFPGGFTVDAPVSFDRLPRDSEDGVISDSWVARTLGGDTLIVTLSWESGAPEKTPPHLTLGQLASGFFGAEGTVVLSQTDLVLKGWPGIELEFAT